MIWETGRVGEGYVESSALESVTPLFLTFLGGVPLLAAATSGLHLKVREPSHATESKSIGCWYLFGLILPAR